eukprot:6490297-Amphidinium_carterae.1
MQKNPTELKELLQDIESMRVPRSRRSHTAESLTLGLYTRQGLGITKATYDHEALIRKVSKAAPAGAHYASIQVNHMAQGAQPTLLHKDQYNLVGVSNLVLTLGTFTGGRIWLQHTDGSGHPVPECLRPDLSPESLRHVRGDWCNVTCGVWFALPAWLWHGVEAVQSGERTSVVLYSPGGLRRVPPEVWSKLQDLSFPCRTLELLSQEVYHRFWQRWHSPVKHRVRHNLYAGRVRGEVVLWFSQDLDTAFAHLMSEYGLCVSRGLLTELDGHKDMTPEKIWICAEQTGFPCVDSIENEQELTSGAARALSYAVHHTPGVDLSGRTPQVFPAIIEEHGQEDEAEAEIEESDPEENDDPEPWRPSESERTAIKQAHDNSGHPQLRRFLRMLRQGGARKEVLKWVSNSFSCDQCLRAGRPQALTPVHVPGTHRFNCVIAADTFDMKNEVTDKNEHWLHIMCLGTSFQVAERLQNKEAMEVWRAYCVSWRRYFGEPDVLIVDAGTEFQSPFAEFMGQTGVMVHVISQESPWENGACERAHQEIRKQVDIMKSEFVPTDDNEWVAMIACAVSVRNSAPGVKGFSAVQRVLGKQPRIAGELTADHWLDAVYEGPMTSVQKAADLRYIATKAYTEQQHRDRLLLATRGRHRIAQAPVSAGQRVWVWRRPLKGRASGWSGTGLVITTAAGSGTAFVHVRGSLWRVPLAHLRPQTPDDRLGWDIVQRFLTDLKHSHAVDKPLRRKFVDCSKEAPPEEEPGVDRVG